MNVKISRDQTLKQRSHQGDKFLGSFPSKILGAILEVDEGFNNFY